MAVLTQTGGVSSTFAPITVARTALTASDTFTYTAGAKQKLFLFNTTASPVAVTMVGTAPTTLTPAGYGGPLSTSAGKIVTVGASQSVMVELDQMSAFLTGTGVVTVTGGVGVTAHLYT